MCGLAYSKFNTYRFTSYQCSPLTDVAYQTVPVRKLTGGVEGDVPSMGSGWVTFNFLVIASGLDSLPNYRNKEAVLCMTYKPVPVSNNEFSLYCHSTLLARA